MPDNVAAFTCATCGVEGRGTTYEGGLVRVVPPGWAYELPGRTRVWCPEHKPEIETDDDYDDDLWHREWERDNYGDN